MDDTLVVSSGEAESDVRRVLEGEARMQRLPVEQFCDSVGDPVVRPEIEDREDVGMRERGDGLGLALETSERFRVRSNSFR